MFKRIARLFTIKTKFEAFLVIYGLGLGAVERGLHYQQRSAGSCLRCVRSRCSWRDRRSSRRSRRGEKPEPRNK